MWRAASTGVFLLGLAATIFTIVSFWQQWASKTTPDGKVALVVFAFFIGVLLTAIVYQEYRYSKKARYAEAISYLNRVFLDIQATAINHTASPEEIRQGCSSVVNTLASAFSLLTATRCAVCIKVIEGSPHGQHGSTIRPKAVTLCRDNMSLEREQGSVRVNHWIDQNTDFEDLHKNIGTPRVYFFSNYLPGMRGYKNTSFEIYGVPWDISIPVISDILRDITWRLPYKSTIVVPISPRSDPARREYALAGYLCVDSRSRGAFTRRYDLDLLTGVADCLHKVVHHYCQLVWTSE